MGLLQRLLGREPAAARPAVTARMQKRPGSLYILRIGGVLNKATVDSIQSATARDIEAGATDLKVLVVLEDFRGWRRGDDWGDIEFFARFGDHLARIAAVGGPQWETQTLLFLAAGRRRGEVRYFRPEQESAARAWLES